MSCLRPANEGDLRRVAEIHVAAWRSAYRGLVPDPIIEATTLRSRLALWREWSADPGTTLLVAEREGIVVGFVRFGPPRAVQSPPPGFGEVTHLYVAPEAVGCGIGHALFEAALQRTREQGRMGLLLWVLEGNTRARGFYEAHGLHSDGARKSDPAWHGEGVFEVRYHVEFGRRA